MADCFLVAVPLALVVVEVYKYWIVAFVLSRLVWFYSSDAFISWRGADDFVWGNDNAPDLGAGG